MARNTQIRRQKIFENALDSAKMIAESEGLAGLTARRIAKDAGCSVGTLYNVFDNLDALILNLNGRTFDALHGELARVEAGGDPQSAARALMEAYLRFVRDNGNLWNVVFEHVWPADFPLPDWYHEKIRRLLSLIARALAPLFPPGREAMNEQAAIVLWSGLHGINSLAAGGKLGIVTAGSVTDLSESLVANFVTGLQHRQRRTAPD